VEVPFFQSGPEVLMRGSVTLTVEFVNRDPWEEEDVAGCVEAASCDEVGAAAAPPGIKDGVTGCPRALHALI